jgi:hypothetical protein
MVCANLSVLLLQKIIETRRDRLAERDTAGGPAESLELCKGARARVDLGENRIDETMAEAAKRRDKEEVTPKWDDVQARLQKRQVEARVCHDGESSAGGHGLVFRGVGQVPEPDSRNDRG